MKLRNVVLVFAIVLAALFVKSKEVRAGGDLSAGEPQGRAGVERPMYPRDQYAPHYPQQQHRPYYPREGYRPSYDHGHGHGYGGGYVREYGNERTYVIGSYYRPYRSHHYSYSYATPSPYRRDPLLTSLPKLILPLILLGIF